MSEVSFRDAWAGANRAFYATHPPRGHFATSVHVDTSVADLLAADCTLPEVAHVTDLGADDGSLLLQLMERCHDPDRVHWRAVDLRAAPVGLDPRIEWIQGDVHEVLRTLPRERGVVIAHELLDDIACDVVDCDEQGRPMLVVSADGDATIGPYLDDVRGCRRLDVDSALAMHWLRRWWPALRPFGRYEVGVARDMLWRQAVALAGGGPAVAIDYGHVLADRAADSAHAGTLVGYRNGRVLTPRTDGSVNITAHVAFDALADAVEGPMSLAPQGQLLADAPWRIRNRRHFIWLRQQMPGCSNA